MRSTGSPKDRLALTDEIAFIAAGAAPVPRIAAHRVSLKQYRRHPRWAFRDPATHALEPVYSVHYNDYAASSRAHRWPTTSASSERAGRYTRSRTGWVTPAS